MSAAPVQYAMLGQPGTQPLHADERIGKYLLASLVRRRDQAYVKFVFGNVYPKNGTSHGGRLLDKNGLVKRSEPVLSIQAQPGDAGGF